MNSCSQTYRYRCRASSVLFVYLVAVKSRSVMRAVRLLDFFTTHPGRGFTLSDLSRQLRLSKSVTHVIATTLADAALLVQNPATHEYRLGPALVPMGDVADRGFAALMHAKDEATRLAEEYESEVLITAATKE